MELQELKDWLKSNILVREGEKFSTHTQKRIKEVPEVLDFIMELTSSLLPETPLTARAASVLIDAEPPACEACNKPLKLRLLVGNYKEGTLKLTKNSTCSYKCMGKLDRTKEKRKKTCLDKYGVEVATASLEVQTKTKATNLKKYGTEWQIQSKDTQKKIQDSNLENFGTEFSIGSKEVREIISESFEKIGGRSEVSKRARPKLEKTSLERYGVRNPSRKHIDPEDIEKLNDIDFLIQENKDKPVRQMAKELGVTDRTILNRFQDNDVRAIPRRQTSLEEKEVLDFIKELVPSTEILFNTRKLLAPKEVDIYLPEYNLAIEYNGIYWHTHCQLKDKNYHLNKTKGCNEKGVQLLHIFSNEWLQKKEIIKSILRAKLSKSLYRVYARKCKIQEVQPKEAAEFLNKNHLQGTKNSRVKLGLYHEGELVSLMTWTQRGPNKEWEMDRFCSSLNTSVVGGASKLVKAFKKDHPGDQLYTYCDLRFSDGGFYKDLGFELSHVSPPNHFYTRDSLTLESRMKYQKHKLKDLLEDFNPEESASVNLTRHGFKKIYDCGNYVFKMRTPGEKDA